MPLKGKYLKYRPEITLEIFTLVWDKLIECGWKNNNEGNNNYDIQKRYIELKSGRYYLIEYKEKIFATHAIGYSHRTNPSETTVQEILGYDPFVKETKEIIPEYVECLKDHDTQFTEGKIYEVKGIYNSTIDVRSDDEGNSNGWVGKFFKPSTKEAFDAQNKPKKPLKQAVHCTTQEEWDFVTEKLGYKWAQHCSFSAFRESTCISLIDTQYSYVDYLKNDYQILSFQEWCDLNGYKMEKEVKFEIGKWYKMNNCWYLRYKGKDIVATDKIYMSECIDSTFNHKYDNGFVAYLHEQKTWRLASIEEIQQYLPDGHPDKIKVDREFKVGDWVITNGYSFNYEGIPLKIKEIRQNCYIYFENSKFPTDNFHLKHIIRHATPEEINQHLISIGQIPAGEPLNTGIEPDKNSMFEYTIICGSSLGGCTTQNHSKALILKNEIIKPTIEFNYLPEPK